MPVYIPSAAPRIVRPVPMRARLAGPRPEGYLPLRATDHVFYRSREPDPQWVERLRALSPVSDEFSWLLLVWEPGEPWIPGQRWTLYEMTHPKWVANAVLEELQGPHPRSEGHMCHERTPTQFQCLCRRKLNAWRGGPCELITRTQYELFRATGYYGELFWIVQGDKGGHKAAFNEAEEEMLRLAGLPSEPPALGDLPFAEPDGRLWHQLTQHNRLRQLGMTLDEYRVAMGPEYRLHKERLARNLRAEYVKWFEGQLLEENDLFIRAAQKGDFEQERPTSVNWEKVEEASTAHYIETGHVLHPSEVPA